MEFRRLTPEEIADTILTEEPEDEEVFETLEEYEELYPEDEIPGNTDEEQEDLGDIDVG